VAYVIWQGRIWAPGVAAAVASVLLGVGGGMVLPLFTDAMAG
jgi:hypothetical protein